MTDVLPLCHRTIVGGIVCKAVLKVVVVEMVKLHAVGEKRIRMKCAAYSSKKVVERCGEKTKSLNR